MGDNRSLLHIGQVSEVNNDSATARAAFDEFKTSSGEAMVSGHMQMLFPASGHWNFFYIPKDGDHVAVNRLPNGLEEGYILGKPYTAENMPQGGAEGLFLMVSSDGKNIIRFDALKGIMDIKFSETGNLKFKNLNIEVEETTDIKTKDLVVTATNDVTVESSNNVYIKAAKDVTIEASNNIDVEATKNATVKATGDVAVEGMNVSVTAQVQADVEAAMANVTGQAKAVVKAPMVQVTGGSLLVNGAAAPSSGPFCALPACLFTGAPHSGNLVAGT